MLFLTVFLPKSISPSAHYSQILQDQWSSRQRNICLLTISKLSHTSFKTINVRGSQKSNRPTPPFVNVSILLQTKIRRNSCSNSSKLSRAETYYKRKNLFVRICPILFSISLIVRHVIEQRKSCILSAQLERLSLFCDGFISILHTCLVLTPMT